MSAELVERIRERPTDERRWTTWYHAVYPKLYYAAFRLTNGNADAARDLTQETFARFLDYRAIERVTTDRHALSFLIKTCRHLAFDRSASARELPRESLEDLDSLAAPEPATDATLDLERLLENLPPPDRELMQWAREGLSVAEIARKLGLTYTAAGVRLHRIRKRLSESQG